MRVIVQVLDENDNRPLFLEKIYKIKLPERERPEKERATKRDPVYRVIASDRDDGPNAEISYSIEEGDENGKFFIEPKTGLVSSKKFSSAGEYNILTVSDATTQSHTLYLLFSLINVGSNLMVGIFKPTCDTTRAFKSTSTIYSGTSTS